MDSRWAVYLEWSLVDYLVGRLEYGLVYLLVLLLVDHLAGCLGYGLAGHLAALKEFLPVENLAVWLDI